MLPARALPACWAGHRYKHKINGGPIAGVGAHHLRGKKGRGAVAPLQVFIAADDHLAAAKVTQGDVASCAHEHILRLEVTVNNFVVVQIIQSLHSKCLVGCLLATVVRQPK